MPTLPKLLQDVLDRYGFERSGECLLLCSSLDSHGYPAIYRDGKRWMAHRYSAHLAHGDVTGKVVMHSCDTPRCVNPEHLRIGTQSENIADRVAKGRNGACRGESAPWSKLTNAKVRHIRWMFDTGENRQSIMDLYGISKTQLYRIARRESWRHI